jgi:alpha-glucosidase
MGRTFARRCDRRRAREDRIVDRAGVLELRGGEVAAHVRLEPFGVSWQMRVGDRFVDAAIDRPTYAYAVSTSGTRIVHSATRDAHDRYYGLGDKTGPLDQTGRRLRTLQLDALGYDAKTSDPLYKHWPFFLGRRADANAWYGVYYDTLSEATFDFGQEFDNYHGFYRSTAIEDGDLDLWFVPGPELPAVVRRFVDWRQCVAAAGGRSIRGTAMALADAPTRRSR